MASASASASARGPRRRLSEQARRDQIVRASMEILAERGYGHATLAAVADRAGVSKGLVSHYFTDRDTLLYDTAYAAFQQLRGAVLATVDLTAPVPEIVRAAIHGAARLPATHAPQLTALGQLILNLRSADGSQRLGVAAYEETYQGQEELFRRGQREGSLRAFDTRVMAITYQSAIDAMVTHLIARPEADADRYADALTDILLAAMGA
jgi:AcrR family transcriptional regulator